MQKRERGQAKKGTSNCTGQREGKKERKWDQIRKKKRRVEALKSCGQQRGGVTSSGGEKRMTHKRGGGGRKVENCPCIQVLWITREDPPTHMHT